MTSVLFALTFLPAFLGMVGPRVNSWSPGGLLRRFRPVDHEPTAAERGRWERVANGVMRHPIAVLVPTLAVLLLAGIPFLQLRQGVPGPEVNPPGLESRDAYVALDTEFAAGETTPIIILADVPGSPRRSRPSPRSAPTAMSWSRSTASTGSRARSRSATRRPAAS